MVRYSTMSAGCRGKLIESKDKRNLPVRARLGTRLVEVDKHFGVTERASAAITSSNAFARQSNGFPLDHFDRCERLGLESHVELFEARSLHGVLPWVLALGPCCGEVGRLFGRNVFGSVHLCYWTHWPGLRCGGRVGRGGSVDRTNKEASR